MKKRNETKRNEMKRKEAKNYQETIWFDNCDQLEGKNEQKLTSDSES